MMQDHKLGLAGDGKSVWNFDGSVSYDPDDASSLLMTKRFIALKIELEIVLN